MKKVYGQLKNRIRKNRERLSAPEYCAPQIFLEGGDWPGDWQGRTILALASLYRAEDGEREKQNILHQLDDILDSLDEHTNEDGYFGELFDENSVNEQQLSGNSWFLRGLCAVYEIVGREEVLARLNRISERYLTKLAPSYLRYPTVKREEGDVGGHLQKIVTEGWRLSSDVGCAFILLDGITHTYEITGNKALLPVIRAMISKFSQIDYVRYNCQTHATLSGSRGVLRFYRLTGEQELLDLAKRNFELYFNYGMTLNYANCNWFGKPYWTETCAVVDSLIFAMQLFEITGERRYIEFANRCYLNALRVSQRPNGGAGCETCLNEKNDCLHSYIYEAFFCCTMRIAECFYELCEYGIIKRNGTSYVLLPFEMESEELSLSVTEHNEGRILDIKPHHRISHLCIYVPSHCKVRCSAGELKNGMLEFENIEEEVHIEERFTAFSERRQNRTVHMLGDYLLLKRDRSDQNCAFVADTFTVPDQASVEALKQYI